MKPRRQSERAVVLVLTVLVLSILVILGFAFSYGAAVNASAAFNARESFVVESAADSAVAWAVALLSADRAKDDVDTLDEEWARDDLTVTVAGRAMSVRIIDEDRCLNVNRAVAPPATDKDPDLRPALKRLVRNLGGADLDYDRLCRWMAPTNTAAGVRPLFIVDALAAVPEMDKGLLTERNGKPPITALLTAVAEHVNINTAKKEVLDALWDDAALSQNVITARTQSPFRDTAQVEAYLARVMGAQAAGQAAMPVRVASDWFRIEARPIGGSGGVVVIVRRSDGGSQTRSARRISEEE